MHVTIATVSEVFFDGQASSLSVPGTGGDMTILPEHMPLVTTLRAGTVTVVPMGETAKTFPIEGGLLEVGGSIVTVVL